MRAHGTRAKYVIEGCHCEVCTQANREYMRRLTRIQLEERYGARPPRFVDAEEVREHLATLSLSGIGRRQVARISGVSDTALSEIKAGRHRRVKLETANAIMAIATDDHVAGRALVDAAPARCIVTELLGLGMTKSAIALALGYSRPALQIPAGSRCTVRNLRRLEVLRQLVAREAE